MAIGPIHLAWLKRLAERGCFIDKTRVIDLGPQDIQVSHAILEAVARKLLPTNEATAVLDKIFDGSATRRTAQLDFYSLFGLCEYASLDADDDRATYKIDLNQRVTGLPQFDVVTNFGTTEHVFNIGEAFRTIHELTAPGGVSLHAIPGFAFINHGFYNIHPNALVEMARANGYELVDFSYIDNTFCRNQLLGQNGIDAINLDELPVKLSDMENTQTFMTKVVDVFYRNLTSPETKAVLAELGTLPGDENPPEYPGNRFHICFVFDLLFVAMRRPLQSRPFVMPMQDPTGVRPLNAPSSAPVKRSLATRIAARLRRRLDAYWH